MKVKTSVTLSSELLARIDKINPNRSSFLEQAALLYLDTAAKKVRDANDATILNRRAARLNREAADVLEYQDFRD
jgi:metal-responsive CopG/Arc/MetJ family transcriptional regulator